VKPRAPLQLLLRPASQARPALQSGLPAEALPSSLSQGRGAPGSSSGYLWDEGEDGNDLRYQRWGVVAPQGAVGDRLLAQAAPLIAWRQSEQGQSVRIYRPPSQLDDEQAAKYRRDHFDGGTELALHTPRYLLLLGDLHELPLSLQQILQTDALVGRLAFSDPAGYDAYIEKLLRSEREAKAAQGQALLYAVPDGTDATSVGYDSLIVPSLDLVAKNASDVPGRVRSINDESGDVPAPDPLLQAARAAQPSVLLSVSHGEGPPEGGYRSAEQQRLRQGAMSFGSERSLSAADLAGQRFLPNGLWLMVACYGAGTPHDSSYRPWIENLISRSPAGAALASVLAGLPRRGERPFVAALPQTLLQSRDGPLGFIGHMDLAWTYSFADLDRGPQAVPRPARFVSALRSALRGDRIGLCLRELMRAVGQAQTELLSLQLKSALTSQLTGDPLTRPGERSRVAETSTRAASTRVGSLWMLRQDLLGYVLLGDPAARLPVTRQIDADLQKPLSTTAAELGLFGLSASNQPSQSQRSSARLQPAINERRPSSARLSTGDGLADPQAHRLPRPLDVLERAFGQALAGHQDPADLAMDLGLSLSVFQGLFSRYCRAGRAALLAGGERDPHDREDA